METNNRKRSVLQSFRDAFRGVGSCIRTERNMRIHITACAAVLFFSSRLKLTRGESACLFLTIGFVMAAEAMNTSVEKLCDFMQKNLNPHIRAVKDIAAGAVLLSACAAVLVGAAVLVRPELWEALKKTVAEPVSLALFLLFAAAAALFIFAGPDKLRDMLSRGGKQEK